MHADTVKSTPQSQHRMNRLAVMTSGGDAPGMNTCIRAIVRTGFNMGLEVYGVRRAFAGLVGGDVSRLGRRDVGGILQQGGTILQTARLPEFREEHMQKRALRCLNERQIDGLIVIGGDGSLTGAKALHERGFPVIGVPATIDNDIWGTNMAIGVDTAINTILESIDNLRDTASSHGRALLVETMGRNNGYLALMAGITGGAEVIHIPEKPLALDDIAERVEDAYIRGKTHALLVISEGAEHMTTEIAEYLESQETGFEVRITILGHVQRGGRPSHFDRLLATRMGVAAVEALCDGKSGEMTSLRGREIETVPFAECLSKQRTANLRYYDIAMMLAK